jgi:aminopeptidase N
VEVRIDYRVEDPPFGLMWTPETPEWPGRPAQIHTQGQPQTNSFWFPTHDFPNERLTTELIVTAPAGYMVSGNGHLAEHRKAIRTVDAADGATKMTPAEVWHWVQDKPHVPYLVTMVVGKFDVVDVGTKDLSMPVYVPPGRSGDVAGTYGRTKDMVAYFSSVLDEPYPWARYAQLVVWNFGWGGMENTSATTLYDTAIYERSALVDHDLDGLIAHELAHQWFGDLVTCNSWEHIWLNEGLATFMNQLWFEKRDGRDEYLARFRGTFDGLVAADKPDAPASVGMVSKVYADPWETFRKPANPYGKGSSVMHMLRVMLGDEQFFRGLATYIDRRKLQTAETSDLRQAMEDASGRSLEQFFAQWCDRPGVPTLAVKADWVGTAVTISVEQTQRIDGDNPAYEFDLPIVVRDAAGKDHRVVVAMRGRSGSASADLPAPARFVAVDPDLAVLAGVEFSKSEAASLAMLTEGPTSAARIQAARQLRTPGSAMGTTTLRRAAADAGLIPAVRVEAARALAKRDATSDLRALLTGSVDSWEVREAVIQEAAEMAMREEHRANAEMHEDVAQRLAESAARDRSQKVRAAAIRGLGVMRAEQHLGVVRRALSTPSQSEILRGAAVDALVKFDTPAALADVRRMTAGGFDSQLRAKATEALGTLGKHDVEPTLAALEKLLSDREVRTRRAAGGAIVALGDARGVEILTKAMAASRSADWTAQLERWAAELGAKTSTK